MKVFAVNLKSLRKENNLSQKALATLLNTTNSSVCDWECERTEPNLEMLKKIALLFRTSADYLIGIEKEDGSRITNEEIEYHQSFKVKRSRN